MTGLEKEPFIFSYSCADTRYISLLSLPTSGALELLLRVCVIGVTKGVREENRQAVFSISRGHTKMQKVKRTEQVCWKPTDMMVKSEQQS